MSQDDVTARPSSDDLNEGDTMAPIEPIEESRRVWAAWTPCGPAMYEDEDGRPGKRLRDA